ncbi:Homeobox protein KNOX3 [Hordeum vulgare]|nr:Homeobox protein KNOX3 [Hordeum vulgare]
MRMQGAWRLSAGGVLVPPPPSVAKRRGKIACIRASLLKHARLEERYVLDSLPVWTAYFQRRHADHLASTNGFPAARGRHNSDDHRQWWDVLERTLHDILKHIEGGNEPPLQYAAPSLSHRSGSSWLPRRVAGSSSSSFSRSFDTMPPANAHNREGRAPGEVGAPSQP